MTQEQKKAKEKQEWDELYQYFKRDIMGYDAEQALPKYAVLRLRGMKSGRFIANKEQTALADYPYSVILLTLKYIKPRLDDLFKVTKFNDEEHKINYVLKIAEANLNGVYNKLKQIKEEQSRVVEVKVDDLPNYVNKYETKKVDESLEKFW